jgi:hypothetical protein
MGYWVVVVEAPPGQGPQEWARWLAARGLGSDSVDRGEMRIEAIRSAGAGLGVGPPVNVDRYSVSMDEARRLGLPEAYE